MILLLIFLILIYTDFNIFANNKINKIVLMFNLFNKFLEIYNKKFL